MAVEKRVDAGADIDFDAGGFAEIDAEGRLMLPASLRDTFGLHVGSVVACFAIGDGIMLIPRDAMSVDRLAQAPQALDDAGQTLQDLLDNLPKVRQEVMIDMYGEEFVKDLERQYGHLVGSALRESHGE